MKCTQISLPTLRQSTAGNPITAFFRERLSRTPYIAAASRQSSDRTSVTELEVKYVLSVCDVPLPKFETPELEGHRLRLAEGPGVG